VSCGLFVPLLLAAEVALAHELYAATGRHSGVPIAAALAAGCVTWLALRFMRASHLSLVAVARGLAAGVLVLVVAIGAVLLLGLAALYVMFRR
jgi:hypothetical protein